MKLALRVLSIMLAAASGTAIGYALTEATGTHITLSKPQATVFRDSLPPPVLAASQIPPTRSAPEMPGWTLRQEPAVFDDLTNVYLSVPSIAPLRCGPRRRATLMLRCLEDRTAAYISHDCATPPGDPTGWQADLRLDDGPVKSVQMEVDSLGEAIGHWQYPAARTFIEALLPADTLAVRFIDARGQQSDMTFPVAGLAPHLEQLRGACHWSEIPPWGHDESTIVAATAPVPAPVTSAPATDGPARAAQTPPARSTYRLLGERRLEQTTREISPMR